MCTRQAGTLSTSFAVGTTVTKQMMHARVMNTIVLPEGELVTEIEADRPTISALKGLGINLAAFLWDTLYVL